MLFKSFSATKRKRRKSMATCALPNDAPLHHWSSQLMVFLVKKQLLLQSALPLALPQNGNAHILRYAALFVPDYPLPLFVLQVAAYEVIAIPPNAFTLPFGTQALA
jgi:hypothetical protein